MRRLVPILDAWAADGLRAALCTVVAVHGRAPLPVGACMIVAENGATVGAVSGGCVEQEVGGVAQGVLRGARSQRLRFAPGGDPLTGAALPCGGGIDVWVQPWGAGLLAGEQEAFAAEVRAGSAAHWRFQVGPVAGGPDPTMGVATEGGPFTLSADSLRRLVLVGAGPVAGALCELAPSLGMEPIVVDPRETIAAHAPIAAASELMLCWPEEAFTRLAPLGDGDAVVALSHQPSIDDVALRAAVATGAGFVGALGSRRSHAERLDRLRERGVGEQALARINGPVGLDLGGWSSGEVALAIAAEIVAARNGRAGGRLAEGTGPIHGEDTPAVHDVTRVTQSAERVRDVTRVTQGAERVLEVTRVTSGGAEAPTGAARPDTGSAAPLAAVVLAAGAGRRFGGAKQTAEWDGEALIARAVRAAADGLPAGSEVVVVLGAHELTVRAALPVDVAHRVVLAPDWESGLGASLRAGVAATSSNRVLVLLGDQPLVDAELVARVVREGSAAIDAGAAAARPVVGDRPGHPVLLGPIALTRVDDVTGDRGIAPLVRELHVHEIAVDDDAPILDVDRPADLLRAMPPTQPARAARRSGRPDEVPAGSSKPGAAPSPVASSTTTPTAPIQPWI